MKSVNRNISIALSLVAAVVTLTSLLGGCGKPGSPNIVLIVVDTLRADHLSCYGYGQNTSPFISELAAQGVLFERAYSASSWTSPGTASIHTSLYPFQHGVTTGFLATKKGRKADPTIRLNRIPEEAVTIAEVLKEAGYRTFAVTDNLNITEEQGFSQGFDAFQNYNYETAEAVNGKLSEWRDEIEDAQPYFLYIHYNDPHQPYNRRKPWLAVEGSRPVTRVTAYDSEIGYVDSKIKEVFDMYGWNAGAVLILTSDHGEEFYEHGELGHGYNLYSQTIHVPLIIYPALQAEPGSSIATPVSTIDVLPTVRAAAGLQSDPADEGISLIGAAPGAEIYPNDRFLISHLERKWTKDKAGRTEYVMKSVISGEWKYIVTFPLAEEFYNLRGDPGEISNVLDERMAVADPLRQYLESFEVSCARLEQIDIDVPVDDKLLEKLESLGYIR
jgi:arylsulfatase A-like enzyme